MMSMAPILMHSEHVSSVARQALRRASSAPPEHRDALLLSAARILHSETGIPCDDVKELVGLPQEDGCGC